MIYFFEQMIPTFTSLNIDCCYSFHNKGHAILLCFYISRQCNSKKCPKKTMCGENKNTSHTEVNVSFA